MIRPLIEVMQEEVVLEELLQPVRACLNIYNEYLSKREILTKIFSAYAEGIENARTEISSILNDFEEQGDHLHLRPNGGQL